MRNKLFLGLVLATGALTGCDKLWAWKLVDCPLSDSRCTGDGGADTPDLIGADLAGSGGREDLAGVDLLGSKPSFVSIAPTSAGGSQVLIGTNRGKVVSCELSNAQNSEGVVLDAEDPGVRAVAAVLLRRLPRAEPLDYARKVIGRVANNGVNRLVAHIRHNRAAIRVQ